MDRIIAKKPWYQQRKKWFMLICVLAIILLYAPFLYTLKTQSCVNKNTVYIGEVKTGYFQEYIYKIGIASPISIININAFDNGRIEKVFFEQGSELTKGDVILQLINTDLLNCKSIDIKSAYNGQLKSIIVQEGQMVLKGEKLGQIGLTNNFKINIFVDSFYFKRVHEGLKAILRFKKKDYHLVVEKVYPEIRSGQFEIELKFIEEQPQNICAGQAFKIKIEFDKARKALLVPRGDFCQTTNGQWIFVLDASGEYAIKRSIKMGGKNPKYYEILEGLAPGEKVLLNSYDLYADSEKLLLK
nr:efflux RND transporter periplasmic adaptor subunit [uncultured Marinifilum sp.]